MLGKGEAFECCHQTHLVMTNTDDDYNGDGHMDTQTDNTGTRLTSCLVGQQKTDGFMPWTHTKP